MIKVSNRKLQTFLKCPRCAWYEYNKDIKCDDGGCFTIPNQIDKHLKDISDKAIVKKKLPYFLSGLGKDYYTFSYPQLLEKWRDFKQGFESEGMIAIPDDIILKECNDGVKIVIVDYKTTANPKSADKAIKEYNYDLQLSLYKHIFGKHYRVEDYGYIVFFWLESFDEAGTAQFNHKVVKINLDYDVETLIKQYKDAMNKTTPPTASGNCRFCQQPKEKVVGRIVETLDINSIDV